MYNPGVQAIGGQLIGQGIANLGQNVRGFFAARQQRQQQMADQAASEAKQRKSLESYLREVEPGNKDRFTAMGLPELQGYAQSMAVKKAQQEEAKQQQSESAMQRIFDSLANPNPIGMGQGPLRPEAVPVADRILAAMQGNGAALAAPGARNLTDLMALIARTQETEGPNKVPSVTELAGRQVVFSPQTGAFQILNDPQTEMTPYQKAQVMLRTLSQQAGLGDPLKTAGMSDEEKAQIRQALGEIAGQPKAPPAAEQAKSITPEIAREFLKQAGGDKAKARELAKKAGYSF